MNSDKQKLDEFGKILIENLRDSSIQFAEKLINGEWKSPRLQVLQRKLSNFSDNDIRIDFTMHYLFNR